MRIRNSLPCNQHLRVELCKAHDEQPEGQGQLLTPLQLQEKQIDVWVVQKVHFY